MTPRERLGTREQVQLTRRRRRASAEQSRSRRHSEERKQGDVTPDESDREPWKHRLLVAGQADAGLRETVRGRKGELAKHGPGAGKLYGDFLGEIVETQLYAIVFFRGRDAFVGSSGPMDGVEPGVVTAATNWLTHPPAHGALMTFAVPAVVFLSCLESFMFRLSPLVAALDRPAMKSAYETHVKARAADGHAPQSQLDFISTKLQPSAKGEGSKWLKRVDSYFGVQVNPLARTVVATLIDFRNAFIHGSRPKLALLELVQSGLVAAWVTALELVAMDLVLAVNDVADR